MADKAYKRGKSGYSVKDEEDAKNYSKKERAISQDALDRKNRGEKGIVMTKDEVNARERTSEQIYLHNTRSEKGRELNKKNSDFMDKELQDINKHKWKGTM